MSSIDELIARVLFLCGFTLLGLLLARRLRLDSSLTCLGAGVLAGLSLPWFNFDTGIRADNLQQLVFYVILPMLIFEAAWYIKPLLLRRWLAPVLILSIPGVLLVTAISGALMYYRHRPRQRFPLGGRPAHRRDYFRHRPGRRDRPPARPARAGGPRYTDGKREPV